MAAETRHRFAGLAHPWGSFINAGLGAWMIASVFVWPHLPHERHYTLAAGVAIVVVSLLGWLAIPRLRWANVALGVALFLATVLSPHAVGATPLNDIIVSMAVITFAFLPLVYSSDPTRAWSVPPTPDV
jgi:hypothetical protein